MLFAKDEWAAFRPDTLPISFENAVARLPTSDGEMFGFDRQVGTHCKTKEIERVGQRMSFIEIVDTPDEPSFSVAPRTKVLDV